MLLLVLLVHHPLPLRRRSARPMSTDAEAALPLLAVRRGHGRHGRPGAGHLLLLLLPPSGSPSARRSAAHTAWRRGIVEAALPVLHPAACIRLLFPLNDVGRRLDPPVHVQQLVACAIVAIIIMTAEEKTARIPHGVWTEDGTCRAVLLGRYCLCCATGRSTAARSCSRRLASLG